MYLKLFFFNICIAKTTYFLFCPYFYTAFRDGKILKNAVVYDQKLSFEVICICLKCKAEIYQKVHIPGPRLSDQMFNAMKKYMNINGHIDGRIDRRIDGHCKIVPV